MAVVHSNWRVRMPSSMKPEQAAQALQGTKVVQVLWDYLANEIVVIVEKETEQQ